MDLGVRVKYISDKLVYLLGHFRTGDTIDGMDPIGLKTLLEARVLYSSIEFGREPRETSGVPTRLEIGRVLSLTGAITIPRKEFST